MTISINQITSGMGLLINNDVYCVTEYQHVKPGKGSAFVRVKMKNIKTGQVLERTFKTADKLEDAPLEEKRLQNLYKSDSAYHFMDLGTYEQIEVHQDVIGDGVRFLQENLEVTGTCYQGQVLKINLPTFIIAKIVHTEIGLKGDSTRAGTKPATIDTGTTIQVPLFVNQEDSVKIDTRSGEYVERVQT